MGRLLPSLPKHIAVSLLLLGSFAHAQTSLNLASSSAVAGGSVSLNLSVTAASGSAPAGLQWTLSYPPADIVSLSTIAGAAVTGVGKTLNCNPRSGSVTCVASGMNATPISSGVVAVVTLTLASSVTSATETLPVTGIFGVLPDGSASTVSGSGGVITVTQPPGPAISKLQCTPTSIVSGSYSTCTATLSQAAPGGAAIGLSSSNGALTVPASVSVAAGGSSATFTATAHSVTSNQTAAITATLNGQSQAATLSLIAPALVSSLACSPTSLTSGDVTSCTVTLSKTSPTGGSAVALSSNNSLLRVPSASVTIVAGATAATFTATAGAIPSNQTATITATLNSQSKTATLNLNSVATVVVSSLACNPTSLGSNASSTCTVTLSSAAPSGGAAVALSDNNSTLTVPASVTIPASTTSTTFKATTGTVLANETGVITASLNGSSRTVSISMVAQTTTYTIWNPTSKPSVVTDSDTQNVELGLKFRSSVAGLVIGVRFYKGSNNTGTHTGHLWSRTGTLLASATFSGESASGWQQVNFAIPVAITANTTYVISYRAPAGHYSDDRGYFASSVTNGPLTALRAGQDGPNGVYRYGTNVFPNSTWQSSNYWVDVVFQPSSGATALVSKAKTVTPKTRAEEASSLSCSPRAVPAGGSFTCELHGSDVAQGAELSVDGADDVMLPDFVAARVNQHSLSFQGSFSESVAPQTFTISAIHGDRHVQDTLTTIATAAPVISIPPDQLVSSGVPVAFKVAINSTDPAVLSAADLPAGASFDAPTGRFEWTPAADQQGVYDLKFAANSLATTSTATLLIEVGSGVPTIRNQSQFACTPGAVGALSGKWLGPDDSVADPTGRSSELSGTSIRVNGNLVPILSASKTYASFVCPSGNLGDILRIELQTPAGAAETFQTIMRPANPTLLSIPDSSQGMIFRAGTNELASVRDVKATGQPAQPGDALAIRATGLGENLPLFVKIGGGYADVLSIAPVPDQAGIWEIQVMVPSASDFGDAVPVQLEIVSSDGRQLRSNTVNVAIEQARR